MQYILKKIKTSQETVISSNYFRYKKNKKSPLSSPKQSFEYPTNIEHDLCFQTFASWSNAICRFSLLILLILQVKDGANI